MCLYGCVCLFVCFSSISPYIYMCACLCVWVCVSVEAHVHRLLCICPAKQPAGSGQRGERVLRKRRRGRRRGGEWGGGERTCVSACVQGLGFVEGGGKSEKPRLKFDMFVLSPLVPHTCPHGARRRKAGWCMCVRVCWCLCACQTQQHKLKEGGKKWAKTDQDKQINRWIEIDRLTARWGKIRERRGHRVREKKTVGDEFRKIILAHRCAHTPPRTHNSSADWLTETDRHAYRLKKGWAEREWQRERERQRETQWSTARYKLKQTAKRQTKRKTDRWTERQSLALFVRSRPWLLC